MTKNFACRTRGCGKSYTRQSARSRHETTAHGGVREDKKFRCKRAHRHLTKHAAN